MSNLKSFSTARNDGKISVSEEQGSRFAKEVAGDYNPIHDPGSSRFCVPGDLLFALTLDSLGLYNTMKFQFLGLVTGGAILRFPHDVVNGEAFVTNERDRPVLGVEATGGMIDNTMNIDRMVSNYVAFSGQNFPHILLPLMEQQSVMVNPERPLVIYESMSFKLEDLEFKSLSLELNETTLEVNGKRGKAALHFSFYDGEKKIGSGLKSLLLSGLREFDAQAVKILVDDYESNKEAGMAKLAGRKLTG